MDDRRAGAQFAGTYPSPNTSIPLQPAQHYPYSTTDTTNNPISSSSTTPHRLPPQQSKPFLATVGDQPQHMSLPPIQHFESHGGIQSHSQPPQSQTQHQHPHPPPYASAPAPPYPPSQYHQYPNGGLQAPMQSGMPSNGQAGSMVRYALPPQQSPLGSRQLNDIRHKKEIKRRTKTGCLTCRKRRIKCDEGHPTCRNCQKSKRECLGYDPIFKQQPGPANIQPAPSGNGTPAAISNNNNNNGNNSGNSTVSGASAAGASSVNPNHYSVAQSYPGTGGTFNPIAGATQGADGQYEYGNPLDPALGGGDVMSQNHYSHALQPQRKVKHISVEELFSLNNIPPRYNQREAPSLVVSPARDDLESFYKYHYAVGLDRLFETSWYGAQGLTHLLSDAVLQDFVAQCTEQFKAKIDGDGDDALLSLEARLVWQLTVMPRAAASAATDPANEALIQELLPRIDTMENLLTGQFLEPSKIPPAESPAAGTTHGHSERTFWHHLGRFVSLRDDLINQSTLRDVNDVLGQLRLNLNMQENRDVLYSLAIGRHIGGRMPEFHPHRQLVASTADQNDEVNKLRVAHDFIEMQEQRGTTQVIQRLCSMSIRSWDLQKQ